MQETDELYSSGGGDKNNNTEDNDMSVLKSNSPVNGNNTAGVSLVDSLAELVRGDKIDATIDGKSEEKQRSNSSSRESVNEEASGSSLVSSTSCSEDSFVLAAVGEELRDIAMPCTSRSAHSLFGDITDDGDSTRRRRIDKESLRRSIDKELNELDTCLPNLDFRKLEEQLNSAAKERLIMERKLLGEQVRRRLALQVDQYTAGPSPRIFTRPSKSNLGFRLQTAMNLQVCYMNDVTDDDGDYGDGPDSSDDEFGVPKSKSAPNLRSSVPDGSNLNASQLRQRISQQGDPRSVLEEETRLMLVKAKQAAKMQMELEKLSTPRTFAGNQKKFFRLQLSRMTCHELEEISKQFSKRIDEENAELMRLLVEKDGLHMQQDSMLVDIEDMIQHENSSEILNLPEFLKVQASTSTSRFRIFKR